MTDDWGDDSLADFIQEDTSTGYNELDGWEDNQAFLESVNDLNADQLRKMSGVDNLEEVEYLEMRVDTTGTSLGHIGTHLPNLKQLRLNSSRIHSVRDLGVHFKGLEVLWLVRTELTELEGMNVFDNLRELYLSFNEVHDLSPLVGFGCNTLEVLDLEGNNVNDWAQVQFLGVAPKLHTLTLEGNPIASEPCYRKQVLQALPKLEILDDIDVTDDDRAPPTDTELKAELAAKTTGTTADDTASVDSKNTTDSTGTASKTATLESEMQFLREAIKVAKVDAEIERPELLAAMATNAKTGGLQRPMSARPGHASRSTSSRVKVSSEFAAQSGSLTSRAGTQRSQQAGRRPTTVRPVTAAGRRDVAMVNGQARVLGKASSDLTFGNDDVMCGNGIRALRSRQAPGSAERSSDGDGDSEVNSRINVMGNLMDQLRAWKVSAGLDGIDFTSDLLDDDELLERVGNEDDEEESAQALRDRISMPPPSHLPIRRSSSSGVSNGLANTAPVPPHHRRTPTPPNVPGGPSGTGAGPVGGASGGRPMRRFTPSPVEPGGVNGNGTGDTGAPVPIAPQPRPPTGERAILRGRLRPRGASQLNTSRKDDGTTLVN